MFYQEADLLLKHYHFDGEKGRDIVLGEYMRETSKLVIQSDKHFTINENPKCIKRQTQTKRRRNPSFRHHLTNSNIKGNTNVLRVICTYNDKNKKGNIINREENYNIDDTDSITDLQKHLVMITISSQMETNEEEAPTSYYYDEDFTPNQLMKGATNPHSADIIDILNVTPLRKVLTGRQKYLLQKYTTKWQNFVKEKKELWSQQKSSTLNNFLDKLKKKKIEINESSESVNKVKLLAKDYNTYQHRYKMQKHIIALQKAKLEEQKRLIEELKYNKIVEASQQSVDTMREEIRKTYYEIDGNLKSKIKCLTNELKIPEIDHSSLILQCLKVPQFLQRMEKRAREREEKHAIIRERRKQMEEERVRLKQQAELAKIEMDKEEKVKRIKELQMKRKKEKIDNIRRKQFAERIRALTVMADLHYEKLLKLKYGIRPWKRLIELKRENIELARVHYQFQLKKNTFLNFLWYTEDMVFDRNYKAEEFYRKKVFSKAFKGFKQAHCEYVCKKQVAEDYYDYYVTHLVFRKLREAMQQIKKEHEMKWEKVVVYYNSNLLFKTFTCWRTLPALNELKRQQEARKARWREKVLQVVPDYAPPED